jgi:hypothetical protein
MPPTGAVAELTEQLTVAMPAAGTAVDQVCAPDDRYGAQKRPGETQT